MGGNLTATVPGESAIQFVVEPGKSTVLVGANGCGKTRLAVELERQFGERAHRISAHRSLSFNPQVPKISQEYALKGLRYGHAGEKISVSHREGNRWQSKAATSLLNDYDYVVQALFAEQSNKALETHNKAHAGTLVEPERTNLQTLERIWVQLLPHRKLVITGDNIHVSADASEPSYSASDMSDGERAIFYLIGQVLLAEKDSVLLVDEPELHVHRSIMVRLWELLASERPDCAFVFITHDLEFASSISAARFVIRSYSPSKGWAIEPVPHDTGFDDELVTLLLGSRRPILFVEGEGSSIDKAVYGACYPNHTIVPRGSCEAVIRSVKAFNANPTLSRIRCSGIVDCDSLTETEKSELANDSIFALPVSEIENVFLLPEVARAILSHEGFIDHDLSEREVRLVEKVIQSATDQESINRIVLRACHRRVDRLFKRIDVSSKTTFDEIDEAIQSVAAEISAVSIAQEIQDRIDLAVANGDTAALLAIIDDKGLLAKAASLLRGNRKSDFESWIVRDLNRNGSTILPVIRNALPSLA